MFRIPEGSTNPNGFRGKTTAGKLGTGTGASDDDPSGIATHLGAQFGYGLLWTILLSYPLMAAIQDMSARIGQVTGYGIAANLRKTCPRPLLYVVLAGMASANQSWGRYWGNGAATELQSRIHLRHRSSRRLSAKRCLLV